MSPKFEIRSFAEFRVARDSEDKPVFEGYAIVFNSQSEDLGGWREIIAPEAVDKPLSEKQDVRALIDHNPSMVIGRSKSGTLTFEKDDHGLKVRISPPDTSYARDLMAVVERGDVSGMSFAFRLPEAGGDEWYRAEDGTVVRVIHEMETMRDVSVVTYPAYPATDVAVRSLDEFLKSEAAKQETPDPDLYKDELLALRQEQIERE